MLFSEKIINCVAEFLKQYLGDISIVVDPVMQAKSGDALLLPEAINALKDNLIPIATIITPNLPEACALVNEEGDVEELADKLITLGSKYILLKGGHCKGDDSNDLFCNKQGKKMWLKSDRIKSKNTHGSGCTLSAAICAFLAKGYSIENACIYAKQYLSNAMLASKKQSVGKGHGPLHHFYHVWPCIDKIIGKWS